MNNAMVAELLQQVLEACTDSDATSVCSPILIVIMSILFLVSTYILYNRPIKQKQ